MAKARTNPAALRLIGAFKLFKGLLLLGVALGVHHLLHRDIALEIERWADIFRVDPHSHWLYWAVERVSKLDAHRLRELSLGTFFYAAMDLTEGTGLMLLQRWAEYLTVIATASFLPLELYEFWKRTTLPRGLVLLVNVAAVAYLAVGLARDRRAGRRAR